MLNGQVSIINAAFNAYRVQYTYSSCVGPDAVLNGVTFSGIGTLDNVSFAPDEVLFAGVTGRVSGTLVSAVFLLFRV